MIESGEACAVDEAEAIHRGIAAYAREQKILLRLLRRYGSFTSLQFDRWFKLSVRRRRRVPRWVSGDTYILGFDRGRCSEWGLMLELLQIMASLGMVRVIENDGVLVYCRKDEH